MLMLMNVTMKEEKDGTFYLCVVLLCRKERGVGLLKGKSYIRKLRSHPLAAREVARIKKQRLES
jgi:hypothetical protein